MRPFLRFLKSFLCFLLLKHFLNIFYDLLTIGMQQIYETKIRKKTKIEGEKNNEKWKRRN